MKAPKRVESQHQKKRDSSLDRELDEQNNCSDDDTSASWFYTLPEVPPTGQYVRISFGTGSEGWWRFLIYRVDDAGAQEYVTNVDAGSFQGVNWPGGSLLYSFQHCVGATWYDVSQTSYDDMPVNDNSCFYSAESDEAGSKDGPRSVGNISWAPGLGAPDFRIPHPLSRSVSITSRSPIQGREGRIRISRHSPFTLPYKA